MKEIAAWILFLGALPLYAQEVVVSKDVREVLSTEPQKFDFELRDVPSTRVAVLYVTAWILTPKFQGYTGALKVTWNGKPLTKAYNRPALLQLSDGRTQPALVPSLGWVVPYIDDPDSYPDQQATPYFIAQDDFNPAVFAFVLPEVFDGPQEVIIESAYDDPKRALHVRDIVVRFEEPKE